MEELRSVVARAHELAREAYAAFVAELRQAHPEGTPELKLAIHAAPAGLQRLYCVDWAHRDEEGRDRLVEMAASSVPPCGPARGSVGGMAIAVDAFVWSEVNVAWEGPAIAESALEGWFERWFDPEDRRQVAGALFGDIIHSVSLNDGTSLCADLGSASPEAFWELTAALCAAGVRAVTVRWTGDARG